jgi:hypothetical protein
MTARQPGEAAKVPRSARKRGRCGERRRNQGLPSSISLQHRTPTGELRLGNARKKTTSKFEILIPGEFYGAVDSWTEYLCLARNADGSITLTSRSHPRGTPEKRPMRDTSKPANGIRQDKVVITHDRSLRQ